MAITITAPARISPSQYFRVLACPYQSLLASTPEARSLPGMFGSGGASEVGTVVHGMLKRSVATDLSDAVAFESVWQELLSEKEADLIRNGASHLVPLTYRANGYAVTKLLLSWHLAMMPKAAPFPGDSDIPFGAEKWLSDNSGSVGGIADLIRLGIDGPEIVDYKTGSIFQLNSNDEAEIKPVYSQQLQLYAALLHEQTGHFPAHLFLADLAGKEHEVEFTELGCLQLLSNARRLLTQMKAAVNAGNPESLAIPSQEQCRYCQVRPLCSPYNDWTEQLGA
ncbi:PD-(D/E)XK nuclease family protein [Hymenobacter sp. BT683]|uniref:PD-(D/E)XK nuclease family protein n=1 Tax=Hymenobacter jeongseonensis TaxID=2791027 RepID=A0ABS0INQ9_9BACT|nr:PD-(D/E)XK nuclease family protein [Hymenobacter jeongseonensis]MBF9239513.1 PD-(D/E)XK nuclease family protein [Hymenobacter jeongseonensis]